MDITISGLTIQFTLLVAPWLPLPTAMWHWIIWITRCRCVVQDIQLISTPASTAVSYVLNIFQYNLFDPKLTHLFRQFQPNDEVILHAADNCNRAPRSPWVLVSLSSPCDLFQQGEEVKTTIRAPSNLMISIAVIVDLSLAGVLFSLILLLLGSASPEKYNITSSRLQLSRLDLALKQPTSQPGSRRRATGIIHPQGLRYWKNS